MTASRRCRVCFYGTVQGVGFRYTTCSLAGRFAVTGFVRNRGDGGVELVAEGAAGQVEAFLQALRDRMAGHIDREETTESPPTNEFSRFEIRR